MKTPKREYKKYYLDPATGEPDEWTLGNIDARWKRKNRIAQLKRTIARLTEENQHLRTLLSLRIQHEYLESQKAALEWAAKHISAHIHQAETTTEWEDSGPVPTSTAHYLQSHSIEARDFSPAPPLSCKNPVSCNTTPFDHHPCKTNPSS